MTPSQPSMKTVLVCDTMPVVVGGVKALLNGNPDLRFAGSTDSPVDIPDFIRERHVNLVVVDKAFGLRAIGELLTSLKESGIDVPEIVVWGAMISPADAGQLLHAGVRGVLLKTSDASSLASCLLAVAQGRYWIEDCILRERAVIHHGNGLTVREQQVLELVQRGLTNKAIAEELQIKTGTVKIHMKHVFEKTRLRGRHAVAMASYQDSFDAIPRLWDVSGHALATGELTAIQMEGA